MEGSGFYSQCHSVVIFTDLSRDLWTGQCSAARSIMVLPSVEEGSGMLNEMWMEIMVPFSSSTAPWACAEEMFIPRLAAVY